LILNDLTAYLRGKVFILLGFLQSIPSKTIMPEHPEPSLSSISILPGRAELVGQRHLFDW
jgi:hypothetical protein